MFKFSITKKDAIKLLKRLIDPLLTFPPSNNNLTSGENQEGEFRIFHSVDEARKTIRIILSVAILIQHLLQVDFQLCAYTPHHITNLYPFIPTNLFIPYKILQLFHNFTTNQHSLNFRLCPSYHDLPIPKNKCCGFWL